MDIDFNKEENTETSEFVNFSIREYVAEIRKKDRKKCWPFGSLGDPDKDEVFASYQFPEFRFLSSRNCPGDIDDSDDTPEHTEAPNPSKVDIFNGKEDQYETTTGSLELTSSKVNNAQCQQEDSVNEGAKIGSTVDADNDELERNRPRKKPQRFRLLSDILRDLAETEDELDDVTLETFLRKQKGDEVTLKEKRKMIRGEGPRLDQDKRLKHGSKDSHGNDSGVGPRSHSTKTRVDDVDMQTMVKHKKSSAEVRSSSSLLILPVKKGAPSCLGSKENAFRRQKDCRPLPCRDISNKSAEVCNTAPTEPAANEDSEMEAVMLLARHFNEENPSRPAHGARRAQMIQSSTRRNVEVEPLEATKCISVSPSSCIRERSHSGGNQPAETGHDQGFANVNISNTGTGMACACVQKKIRESSTPGGKESIPTLYTKTPSNTATKDLVFYADTHKKFTKEKLEVEENRSSCIPMKGTNAKLDGLVPPSLGPMVFQPLEICMMKAPGVACDAQKLATLVCSINRNPADSSIPNAENKFMRGG